MESAPVLRAQLASSSASNTPHQLGILLTSSASGSPESEPHTIAVGDSCHRPRHELGDIPGKLTRRKMRAGGHQTLDAIHAEGPPVRALRVPSDEVPKTPRVMSQAQRLDGARCGIARAVPIVEPQLEVIAARRCDPSEHLNGRHRLVSWPGRP